MKKNTSSFLEKQICIFGYGREGQSTLRFLTEHLKIALTQIMIHDENMHAPVPPGVNARLGPESRTGLDQYDIIVRSAGVSPHRPEFVAVGDKLTTQLQIFFDTFAGKVIAITGTKGKSTTTTLIYELLKTAGYEVAILGNMGLPPLDLFLQGPKMPERVVMEVSSYQADGFHAEPYIGILTSLYHEHHADRHGGEEQYFASKLGLIEGSLHRYLATQTKKEHPTLMQSYIQNPETIRYGPDGQYDFHEGKFFHDTEIVGDDSQMQIPGIHNRYNVCVLRALADQLGIAYPHIQHVLSHFTGLEHRLEEVGTHAGIRWINDAISTTPESTIAALDAFPEQVDTIFLGGKDGHYTFDTLIEKLVSSPVRNIVLFPVSGTLIKSLLPAGRFELYETADMHDAVLRASRHTKPGAIALLSCASPSYSIWKNFEEKGSQFKTEVRNLPNTEK